MNPLTFPVLHRNGTAQDMLMDDYDAALQALRSATIAVQYAAPNPRDYYLLKDSFEKAHAEHVARLQKLADVIGEIAALMESVANQPNNGG